MNERFDSSARHSQRCFERDREFSYRIEISGKCGKRDCAIGRIGVARARSSRLLLERDRSRKCIAIKIAHIDEECSANRVDRELSTARIENAAARMRRHNAALLNRST